MNIGLNICICVDVCKYSCIRIYVRGYKEDRVKEREGVMGKPDAATLYSRRHQNLIIHEHHSQHAAIRPVFHTPVTERVCWVA